MSVKIDFIFNFIKSIPKIGLRYLNMLGTRKKLNAKHFRPDTAYSIEGALNQLLWDVENAVFITISSSSEIFFDTGQLLFHVKKEQTQYKLTAYGVGRKLTLNTQIKVVALEKFDFGKITTKSKSIPVDFKKTISSSNIAIRNIDIHSISFQKSQIPRVFRKIEVNFNHLTYLKRFSTELVKTNSIQEVNDLKEAIENNLKITLKPTKTINYEKRILRES